MKNDDVTAPVRDSELNAENTYQFIAMLKLVHARSGRKLPWIAEKMGISRSAAYNLVDLKLLRFPFSPEHVKEFTALCGLPEHQQERVLRLWAEVRDRRMNLDGQYHVPGTPVSHPSGVCCSCSQATEPTATFVAEREARPRVDPVQMGVLLLLIGALARQAVDASQAKVA